MFLDQYQQVITMNNKINKHYISETDVFLTEIRDKIPESESQRKERLKHERVAYLRDNEENQEKESGIWEDF